MISRQDQGHRPNDHGLNLPKLWNRTYPHSLTQPSPTSPSARITKPHKTFFYLSCCSQLFCHSYKKMTTSMIETVGVTDNNDTQMSSNVYCIGIRLDYSQCQSCEKRPREWNCCIPWPGMSALATLVLRSKIQGGLGPFWVSSEKRQCLGWTWQCEEGGEARGH